MPIHTPPSGKPGGSDSSFAPAFAFGGGDDASPGTLSVALAPGTAALCADQCVTLSAEARERDETRWAVDRRGPRDLLWHMPKAAPPANGPDDPRVRKLLDALRSDPSVAPSVAEFEAKSAAGTGRKFGSNGLKANGKLFALFTQGTLVVKLPKDRVAALVAKGHGEPFDPGHGRLMKEWLTVASPRASWVNLAKEAHAFVDVKKR